MKRPSFSCGSGVGVILLLLFLVIKMRFLNLGRQYCGWIVVKQEGSGREAEAGIPSSESWMDGMEFISPAGTRVRTPISCATPKLVFMAVAQSPSKTAAWIGGGHVWIIFKRSSWSGSLMMQCCNQSCRLVLKAVSAQYTSVVL